MNKYDYELTLRYHTTAIYVILNGSYLSHSEADDLEKQRI